MMVDSLAARNPCGCTVYTQQEETKLATREQRLAVAMVETYGKQKCLLRASHIRQSCEKHALNYEAVVREINILLGIAKKQPNKKP